MCGLDLHDTYTANRDLFYEKKKILEKHFHEGIFLSVFTPDGLIVFHLGQPCPFDVVAKYRH